MGLRWNYRKDRDIKMSGLLVDVALDLGYLTRSKEYKNCFVDNYVVLTRAQVTNIVNTMLTHNDFDLIDMGKYNVLQDWLADTDEESITFS